MKKLLLVPVVVMTGLLVFAFLMPATAASVLRSFAPAARISLPAVLSAGSRQEAAATPAANTAAVASPAAPGGSSSPRASSPLLGSNSQPSISLNDRNHEVATAGEVNCGRYGRGTHGGKHDFTCPNQPFPVPAN